MSTPSTGLPFPDGWANRAYTALCEITLLASAVQRLVAEVKDGLISDDNQLLAAVIACGERTQEMADEVIFEVLDAPPLQPATPAA